MDNEASGASAVFPALRTQTRTTYPSLADPGFQDQVELVVQAVAALQLLPLNTHHRYWYGATPPDAEALQRMVLPAGCGEAGCVVTVSVIGVTGAGAATVNGTVSVSSPLMLLLPELRAATRTL